jgi:type I restriction enzyme, S subunit
VTVAAKHNWARKRVGQVANVVSGYAFKSSEFGQFGIPVIKIKNVRVGYIDLSDAEFVPKKFLSIPERYHVHPGDILISLTGSHISQPNSVVGRVARHSAALPICLLNQRVGKVIIKDDNACDLAFLFYALSERETVRSITLKAHGAANQANVSPAQIESIEIPIPSLSIQRRIAAILSAYDDLIEINRRRIALLEDMARLLFEEWFVRLNFPGRRAPSVQFEAIPLPQEWNVRTISSVATFVRGCSYRSADLVESGGMPFVNLKCFLRGGGFRHDGLKRYNGPYQPDQLLKAGDLVLAVTDMTQERRIVGQAARVPRLDELPAVPSMDVLKIIPAPEVSSTFLYHWLRFSGFSEKAAQAANGANVLHLTPAAIFDFPIVLPPEGLQKLFEAHIQPVVEQLDCLHAASKNLSSARDLLLPRLISGELSVSAAEQELETAA